VTVICLGELMVQVTRWRLGRWRGSVLGGLKIVILSTGAAIVPLVFAFGPVQWHNLRDVQTARVPQFVVESYTYQKFNPNDALSSWFVKHYGILPFFLVGALALPGLRRTKLVEWAALLISFCLCVFSLLLTLWQYRWAGLHAAMSVLLTIVVGHIAWRNVLSMPAAKRPTGVAVFLSALVLGQAVFFTAGEFSDLDGIRKGKIIKAQFVDTAMKKYLALGLQAESRGQPMRVICDPDIAPVLYYFGRIPAVTSYYWENVQGLHDATAFFMDHGDAVARRIASERGLTHVIVPAGGRLQGIFHYIETGNMNVTDASPTLAMRLASNAGGLPPWITLDERLTRIGRREFNLATAGGIASLQGRVTVYRIEPTVGAGPSHGAAVASRP